MPGGNVCEIQCGLMSVSKYSKRLEERIILYTDLEIINKIG